MPRTETDIAIVDEGAETSAPRLHLCAVQVSNHVSYQRKQISNNRAIEVCDLELPERTLVARLLVHGAGRRSSAGIAGSACRNGSRREHGLIGMLPLFICDGGTSAGCRWRSTADRTADDLRLRRLSGRRGIAELRSMPRPARAHARSRRRAVRRRVPVVRAVAEVRQLNEYLDKGGAITPLGLMARAAVRVTPRRRRPPARPCARPSTTTTRPIRRGRPRPGAPRPDAGLRRRDAADESSEARASAPASARRRPPVAPRGSSPRRRATPETQHDREPHPATMSTLTLPRRLIPRWHRCGRAAGRREQRADERTLGGRGTATTVTGSPTPPDRSTSTVTPARAGRARTVLLADARARPRAAS